MIGVTLNIVFSYLKYIVDVPSIGTLESNESHSVQQGILEHAWSKNNFFRDVLCGMNSSQYVWKMVMQQLVVTCPKEFRQRCKFHYKPVKTQEITFGIETEVKGGITT